MKHIFSIAMVFLMAGVTGCSSGPSESELQELIYKTGKAPLQAIWDMTQKSNAVMDKGLGALGLNGASEGGHGAGFLEALKVPGLADPDTYQIIDLSIEDSFENDKGDYVVKTTYVTVYGDKKEMLTQRITLMKTKDSWRILSAE